MILFNAFRFFVDYEIMTAITPIDQFASPSNQKYSNENNNNHEFEDKIVQEFNHLLEKSKQLFNGLRYN